MKATAGPFFACLAVLAALTALPPGASGATAKKEPAIRAYVKNADYELEVLDAHLATAVVAYAKSGDVAQVETLVAEEKAVLRHERSHVESQLAAGGAHRRGRAEALTGIARMLGACNQAYAAYAEAAAHPSAAKRHYGLYKVAFKEGLAEVARSVPLL